MWLLLSGGALGRYEAFEMWHDTGFWFNIVLKTRLCLHHIFVLSPYFGFLFKGNKFERGIKNNGAYNY
jgi:hypothetical protein